MLGNIIGIQFLRKAISVYSYISDNLTGATNIFTRALEANRHLIAVLRSA